MPKNHLTTYVVVVCMRPPLKKLNMLFYDRLRFRFLYTQETMRESGMSSNIENDKIISLFNKNVSKCE